MKNVFLALLLLPAIAGAYDHLPNPELTPGKAATTDTQLVCEKGYPERARHVTEKTKREVYSAYQIDKAECRGGCKIDHLIPLAIGGSNDKTNLWPHEYDAEVTVYAKTRLEVRLRKEVCSGRLDIVEAQACIQQDWPACYNRFFAK